jgi:hypothetical protein
VQLLPSASAASGVVPICAGAGRASAAGADVFSRAPATALEGSATAGFDALDAAPTGWRTFAAGTRADAVGWADPYKMVGTWLIAKATPAPATKAVTTLSQELRRGGGASNIEDIDGSWLAWFTSLPTLLYNGLVLETPRSGQGSLAPAEVYAHSFMPAGNVRLAKGAR